MIGLDHVKEYVENELNDHVEFCQAIIVLGNYKYNCKSLKWPLVT